MFENKDYTNIKNDILNNIHLDVTKNEGSILDAWASGSALAHASFYVILEGLLGEAFIKSSTGDDLDRRINEFGIYRKEGKVANGNVLIKSKPGYENFKGGDGVRLYYLDNEYLIIQPIEFVDGEQKVIIEALENGKDKNLSEGIEFTFEEFYIESAISIEPIQGGVDMESDEDFKERFYYTQAHKGTSGNVNDYINWSYEVDGVKNVKVIPLWNGNGTVKVLIMGDDNRNVDSTILENAREYINYKKPIGANVTVTTPKVRDINISAILELETSYELAGIKKAIEYEVNEYLVSAKEVTYTKIAGIISKIEGVLDYKDLKINGDYRNITLSSDEVGSVGTITLEKGEVI